MPQALPMVAAWAATAWTSAVTVTVGALASVGTVAAIGEGATIALASGILKTAAVTAISAAATALMRPNTPSSGTTLDFKPDPKAPVRGAMGFTAVGGNKVFQATWGYKRVAMSLGVALSLGPIQGVAAFEADGSTVAFNPANQYEALGFYDSDMWQRTTLGLPGDAALLPPTGLKYGNPGLTGWGLQNAAPQTAFAFWTMVLAKNPEDRDIFTNGVPDPRWILNGMRVWQPRFDSTYPGGSGPQRRDDWRTWGWSENPYDHALAWVRGHYKLNIDGSIDKTKRIAGVGAPDSAIDIPAFVEGANISDANGWTISGEWSTSDGKWQTLVAMLQAGGGQPINRGAQISVLVNAPRVSTYTYTKADLVGQAQIKPLTPRRDRKNTIIPRYRSQPNGWEYVAAGEVTASTYRTEDRGEQRSTEAEYVHVRDARQAGQLAAYDLVNLREGLTATLPSKVHLMSVHAGDCITVDVPELALANQKFVVMRTTTDYKSAVVTLELRSETDAKHAFALGQVGQAPPSPSLSAVDPRYIAPPVADDWSVMPQPPSGGTTQPIVIVIGKTEVGDAASIIVETGPSTTGPWSTVYAGTPLLDGRYPSPGLQPGQQYWVSVRYVAKNGAISDRLIQGPITASQLVAGDVSPNAPGLSQIRSDIEAAFGGIFDVSTLLSQTRLDLEAADAALGSAIGSLDNRADILETQTQSLEENKASVASLDAQIVRINGVEAVNATQALALVDLENGKVALSEYNTLKGEVLSARDGAPSLLGKIQNLKSVDLDLEQNKASVASVEALTARTANTEADIIDLENALATETGARAQAIQQVTAKLASRPNIQVNGGFENGTAGIGWGGASAVVDDVWGRSVRFIPGGGGTQVMTWPSVSVSPGRTHTFSGDMALFMADGAELVQSFFAVDGFSGNTPLGAIALTIQGKLIGTHDFDASDARRQAYAISFTTPSNCDRIVIKGVVADPVSAINYWSVRQGKLEFGSLPATPYSGEASERQLAASVTEQSLAIIDLENQNALASWRVKTEATGGRPTILQLLSGSFGSSIAMTAEQIYFGDNTVFDDATDTIQTVWGSTRKVMAWGAPFGPDNLVEWTGPSNISLGSMTKANAGFWVDRFGAYGPTPLPSFWAKVTPTQISRSRTGAGSISTALNDVIVTCYTGTSGATCTWSRVSGDTTINYPSTGFTPVFNTTLAAGQTKTALFVGLVAKGGDVDLVYVNVEFSDNV